MYYYGDKTVLLMRAIERNEIDGKMSKQLIEVK